MGTGRKLLRSETNAIRNVKQEHSMICVIWYAKEMLKPWLHRKSHWGKFNSPSSDSNDQGELLKSDFINSWGKEPKFLPIGPELQDCSGECPGKTPRQHTCKISVWVRPVLSQKSEKNLLTSQHRILSSEIGPDRGRIMCEGCHESLTRDYRYLKSLWKWTVGAWCGFYTCQVFSSFKALLFSSALQPS